MPIATLNCPANKISEARRQDVISHFILRLAFCQRTVQNEFFFNCNNNWYLIKPKI